MTSLLLFALYALSAAGIAGVATWLKRPFGWGPFLVCFVLPVAFLLPGFVSDTTPVPVDHIRSLTPWRALGPVTVHNPNLNDVALQFAPWQRAVRAAWSSGELPHRDRWNGCGTPLAANGSSSAFSPVVLLGLVLPLARSFVLQGALKLLLALAGTWLWLTELRVSRDAALLASVAFAFSFTMTPWLYFPQTAVLCLWPWALFAIELSRDKLAERRAFALLVAVFAIWPLSGHIESVVSGAALVLVWVLARWAARDLSEAPRLLRRAVTAGFFALALSAFALLPHVLAILASERFVRASRAFWEPGFSWAPHGPLWANGLVTTFFPRSLGDSIDSPTIPGRIGSFSEMGLGYFGIVGWGCALLILRPGSRRSRAELALLVPAGIGLAVAVGLWPFAELFGRLPGLKMMFPLRFLSWVAICGAAIAAFELDRLREDLSRQRLAAFSPVLVAVALGAFALITHLALRDRHAAAGGLPSQRESLSLTLLALAGFALAAASQSGRSARAGPVARPVLFVVAVAAVELLFQGSRLYRFGSPGSLAPGTPLLRFLQGRPRPFRVVGEGTALFPNSNVFAGLEDVRTHDPVERHEYVEFLDAAAGYRPSDYFKRIEDLNAPALDFLNVKYLVSGPSGTPPGPKWRRVYSGADGTVFENSSVLPRVFAPDRVELPGTTGRSSSPRRQDWKLRALLLRPGWKDGSPLPFGANGRAVVSEYFESGNSVAFRASVGAGQPSLLVTSLTDDGGWTAEDDGRRIAAGRANGPFLALLLRPGEHAVRMKYSPPGFREGVWISLAGLVALSISLAAVRRRGRRPAFAKGGSIP